MHYPSPPDAVTDAEKQIHDANFAMNTWSLRIGLGNL